MADPSLIGPVPAGQGAGRLVRGAPLRYDGPMILDTLIALATLAAGPGDYAREVKPVLARRCVACHGALKRQAGLRLDTAAAIRRGGNSGAAVEPSDADASLLLDRVADADPARRMPPEGEPLKAEEVDALRRWVADGATVPEAEPTPADPRKHWAFRPAIRPVTPQAPAGTNPIDAFLGVEHRRLGLTPRPRADKAELLRRVSVDLTGLAPTREVLRAYLDDPAADAYRRAVDRLLASPTYGERWGRHWMDIWRYSDWDGFGTDPRESRPGIWRWRDWIVESLNADLGYDRMAVLMLAADEAAPLDDEAQRATGFLARNWDKFSRVRWLDNAVEHTAKAFLGLTIACARCHDHKYDPTSQADYYRFRAIFEPHEVREDRLSAAPEGIPRAFDAKPDEPTYLFARGDDLRPDRSRAMEPGVPAYLTKSPIRPTPVGIPPLVRQPSLRPVSRGELKSKATAAVEAARKMLAAADPAGRPVAEATLRVAEAGRVALSWRILADEARISPTPGPEAQPLALRARRAEAEVAAANAELRLSAAQSKLSMARAASPANLAAAEAELAAAGAALAPAFAARQALATDYTPVGPVYPPQSTGRRLALARWIASTDNPLTARVAVNHAWARHFGRPLVDTMSDFGLNGRPSTHPALLDWLATEFMASGWSLKALHRLIVTSDAYTRQSSPGGPDANLASDPENIHYWRMNPRRLEAEAVRDNLLAASGQLDPSLGGPDLDPGDAVTSGRRSLYLRHAMEKRSTFLKVFDSPNANDCYRRFDSVVPQQALALANSPLALESARRLASRLSDEQPGDPGFVASAFEAVLGRGPDPEERVACETFLVEQNTRLATPAMLTPFDTGAIPRLLPSTKPKQRAREGLVHSLFNHNDFVTIR